MLHAHKGVIRHARLSDMPRLMELEELCWPEELRVPESTIRQRMVTHAVGQLVVEAGGEVRGVVYSQRIDRVDSLFTCSFDTVDRLHRPDGPVAHVLSLNVDPRKQSFRYGDLLLEHLLTWCQEREGLETAVGVTRCRDFGRHSEPDLEAYIHATNEQGRCLDTVLRMHQSHGARIRRLVPGYRPGDRANGGNGVLVTYDLPGRAERIRQLAGNGPSAAPDIPPLDQLADEIREVFLDILGADVQKEVQEPLESPLFELGFDSASVSDLQERVQSRYGITLDSLFFFEHDTGTRIIEYLDGLRDEPSFSSPCRATAPPPGAAAAPAAARQSAPPHDGPHAHSGHGLHGDPSGDSRDVAIIGIACRLPGGIEDPAALWRLLEAGGCAIGTLPEGRWRWPDGAGPDRLPGIDRGGFVTDAGSFEAGLFRVTPREARLMDPQQRWMLELSWACLEDAGYPASKVAGASMGVFVGASGSDYQRLMDTEGIPPRAHSGVATSMAVIANRVSYFYDLRGPSVQLDTACSSSLVAVHTAVRALRAGECETALVGGVNVLAHPANSVAYHRAGMLSPDGLCKTFDASADGYVRSEGGVVLLLKPLAAARADGDHVHAVIKGSATNHGGRTGGLTVPSAAMQASLVEAALADARVTASDIGYVEAHGTGTALGDPIEVRGLARAFAGSDTPCAIGSVKTNLGHLEAAAGITGLLKIVLSLRYGKLPATLHQTRINPQIELAGTPFSVADRLTVWEPGRARRLAGVSSFGSGGSNAHVIVGEPPADPRAEAAGHGRPASRTGTPRPVVVLSARTETGLLRQAERFLAHLRAERTAGGELTHTALMDLAYTTQVGREALTERLALLPADATDLTALLDTVVSGTGPLPPTALRGRKETRRNGAPDRTPAPAAPRDDAEDLLAAWLRGEEVEWERLYDCGPRPRRVPLPTHAFTGEHYWLDTDPAAADASGGHHRPRPLLPHPSDPGPAHHGTGGAAFESAVAPHDFFLRDHRVGGEHVLPAAAHLEMARAAAERALPAGDDPDAVLCLENVVWSRPLVVGDEERTVRTVLTPEAAAPGAGHPAGGRLSYETTTGEVSAGTRLVHARGVASRRREADPRPRVDVEALRARTTAAEFTADAYYETLRAAGLDYGDTHRALREIRLGDGEVLAFLGLPDAVADTRDDFVLHPSILDGALQAGFVHEARAARETGAWSAPLPFALDRLEVFGATPRTAYAWLREAPGTSGRTGRWDVDLCDEQGHVFATLRGYSMRKTSGPAAAAATADVTLWRPVWREKPATAPAPAAAPGTGRTPATRLVLACGFEDRLDELRAHAPHLTFLDPPEGVTPATPGDRAVTAYAVELLRVLKALLPGRPADSVLLQVLTPPHGEPALNQALAGLLGTARMEHPALVGQVLAVPADAPPAEVAGKLEADGRTPQDRHIDHGGGRRRVLGWEQITGEAREGDGAGTARPPTRWRAGGVYLVTGGAGALGAIVAEEIARRARGAVVCLTGRSPQGPAQEAGLAALRALGAEPEYRVLDVTDARATAELVTGLTRRHGGLHGVVHAAGVVHDTFLLRKPVAEFRRVLAPKVDGCRNLDEATKDSDLDFFVLFSSLMGTTGNVGQGDYAVANAFLDAFARHRGARVHAGERSGRTVAIGWPLWQSGGMGTDVATRRALRERHGLLPMTTEAGVRAFHLALDSGETRVAVVAGEAERTRTLLEPERDGGVLAAEEPSGSGASGRGAGADAEDESREHALAGRAVSFLRDEFSRLTGLPAAEIDADEPLGSYGMDSMLATELTAGLEKTFGSLSKTLLFEYHTLAELGTYFAGRHRPALDALFAASDGTDAAQDTTGAARASGPEHPAADGARTAAAVPRPVAEAPSTALDIAVIGLSGRYPQSPDLRAYWQNLRDGRDCVVEIPEDRWDWRAHYSPDRDAPGRHYSRWGGFIADVDRFDPLFFNISPREAGHLDPQERLFLEHAWTAMEDAGYTRERLRRTDGEAGPGAVGVYAGVMWGQYQLLFPGGDEHTVAGNPHALGSSYASIANRVSFVLNLHGPSMTVDTMCSSSLTAVELACRDLSRGRIGLAFAGGVNVTVHPNKYLALSAGQFISGKGHCESFGIGGDGYIPGEGVGVALLKPLRDAERDGDHIYGVIKGSALSHGGRTNGYTVPNPRAQRAAITSALRESGVDPRTIGYVEAHGTGTRLGDPIEITGLSEAFQAAAAAGGADDGDRPSCRLGSVKSNIGHCESAAGIAGLTKVLLQMKHGRIAPSLHSATLNPNIDFAATPFVVNQELRDWERPVVDGRTHPRVAGVSSFGAGGSNAHLVVAEHIDRRPAPAADASGPLLFPLSAKTADRLQAYAGELLRFAREQEHEEFTGEARPTAADLAYTLQTGREAMEERLAVVADSFAALAGKLERYLAGREPVDGLHRGSARRGRGTAAALPQPRTRASGARPEEGHGPAALAARWVGGEPVDWETLYAPGAPAPRRISAPTYPFARERHWAPATAAPTPDTRPAAATDTDTPAEGPHLTGTGAHRAAGPGTALFLTKRWRETPPAAGRTPHTSVLVLHDRTTAGLAAALAGRLDDATPLDVAAGDAEAVVARRIGACTAWIDLTGIAGDAPAGPAREHGGAAGRAVSLLQSALDAKAARGIRLLYVTRGLESPGTPGAGEAAGRSGSLAGAARAALHRLLGHEYRGITSCHLDLDPAVRGDAEQASVILGELADGARETEVCHRAGVRLVPVLAETPPPAERAPRPSFGPGEVLLVTGGTRGLGLLCARHLVEHYGVRRLVLTGREPLPPRGRWADPDTPPSVREKTDAVLDLEARGVEVRVLALPLDRAGEVAAALATIESTLGRITGVIHAAGLVDTRNPAFVRKPAADIARVVSPKIDGTAHLLAALDGRAPRFVLLFSSVSAVIPALGAGQSDYAMGNAFLDYAAQAHAADLPVTSIQWPSWRETGFGEVTNRAYTDTGLLSITDAEGLAFLDDILTAPRGPVVMPVRVDAGRFHPGTLLGSHRPDSTPPAGAAAVTRASAPIPEASAVPAPASREPAPAAGTAAVRERLSGFLRRTFEEQLGLERGRLDEDVPYADYGADSILLAQVFQRIRQHLDVALDPSALLDHPTLGELAAWLLSAHPAEVAARFGPGPQPAGGIAGAPTNPAAPDGADRPGAPERTGGPDGPDERGRPDGPDGPGGPEEAYGRAARTPAGTPRERDTAVAVIGMAARLPGAPDVDAYWELLSHGRSAVRTVPADRWGGETDARAGIVDDVYGFDAGYFMLHAEDVRAMDPQALVLLEECLKAVHHAGYRPAELDGTRTGVFVGARSRGRADDTALDGARNPIMTVGQNYLAANVSQFFDWHGPALVVDTACSSSLVAMRAATDALLAGSADLALVAGVSLLTDDSAHALFRRRGLLREDGTFHLFDRRAGGVVLGEGAGVVVLKPLDRAERDGDTVYAVVEGIALNNDGRTAGPATPNPAAQKEVMGEALRRAGRRPDEVGHLDVNGSGSELTDLLELKAVEAVYGRDRTAPLRLGSMKPNIGHPLCAEGIAAFVKVALMLHHQRTVPFLSGEEPMEHYTIDPALFDLPRHSAPVELSCAALSSFADGGTNAHVVLGRGRPGRRRPLELPALDRRDVRTGTPLHGGEPTAAPAGAVPTTGDAGSARPLVWTRRIGADDALLDGHRVHGRRLLPGLAWIDLLYGCFAELVPEVPYAGLALRELTIYRPLSVDTGREAVIRIEARAEDASAWRITVTDAAPHGPGRSALPYITAEAHRTERTAVGGAQVPADVLDVLRAAGAGTRDLEEVYRSARADALVHSGPMKAVGAVYGAGGDLWLRVALDERAADGDRDRLFHPALIDASAVAANEAVLGAGTAADGTPCAARPLFLPLHYGSFQAGAPLGRSCYTRVRRDSVRRRADLLTLTMEFFDTEGCKIGELRDLTTKAVRDAAHLGPADPGPARRVDVPAVSGHEAAGTAETAVEALTPQEAEAAVAEVVAARLGLPADRVARHSSYYELGLDSAALLGMARDMEARLGTRLAPTLLFEHTTVAALAAHLARHHRRPVSAEPPARNASPEPSDRSPSAEARDRAPSPEPPARVPSPGPEVPDGTSPDRPRAARRPAVPAPRTGAEDIAIIGIGGRYPKAADIAEFWENLKAGRDCVTEVPENRWPRDTFRGERTPSGRAMPSWGGFLDDVDCFDAGFFGIPADEAARLDPQERLFLEVCWEAIEDAGHTPAGLTGSGVRGPRRAVGVFVGVMHQDYALVQHDAAGRPGSFPPALNAASIAHRVSHFCDFNGPSMAVDTVCASSLSALHLAVESLRRGECDAALAGGVNLALHPARFRAYGTLDLLAGETPARSFAAGGEGYVPAEGVGAVLLKPLDRALADGDAVYAVIKGTAVNHSGRTPGPRVPSVAAQAALIEDCLDRAGIDPATLGWLEAHGTGTEIGDLIEIQALRRVFEDRTDAKGFCGLGSVKSAIGHAEAAAGISALTKAALQLHHATLTPLVRAERPNPYLDLDDSPFRLQTDLREWTADTAGTAPGAPRRAGVSAFGATGANAHVVLEEAPPHARDLPGAGTWSGSPRPVLVPLSATDGERLRAYAGKLLRFLDSKEGAEVDAAALAHTLQTGRVALAERAVVLAHDLDELKDALAGLAHGTGAGSGGLWRGRAGEPAPEARLLDEDDLRAELVARWAARGKWDKIAELWTGGYAVDWRALYDGTAPRRLHLPTYPFAKRRHWVGVPDRSRTATRPPAAAPSAALAPAVPETPPAPAPALPAVADPLAVPAVPAVSAVPAPRQPRAGAVRWRYVPEGEPLPERPEAAAPGGREPSPEEKARGFLRQLVAERLGRAPEEIGPHTGLIDLGLTSLGAVELTKELAATVDPAFLPSVLFEHTTVAEVAAYLAARRPAALARLVATAAARPPAPERPPGPRPDVLAVLADLHTGELRLDDAIALLDTDGNEK
ncbi:hypothetical protein TU94_29680 [Streptomyces cyaneogriseus subsp. noncyanogenus]|uniref:Polyketide synthase n=1 Tax=Streptomyces cyaneogriseus subsp. noncyanogenus TaxID=477245 RepID=A0A0C5FY97_9ACTN|nr:SDR family NAD(P)-dependent oxidoreductase [Streptomyces cyaneogriseus]AJP04992.1 hypothetical protein TU94_29680 [Streptomyces cyaneogriseus subsp. noncyanogenus]